MIDEFVLDYVRETYELPKVSIPAIIEILGLITKVAREFVEPCYYHFILLKSDMPSQVSSIFKNILPLAQSLRNSTTHC